MKGKKTDHDKRAKIGAGVYDLIKDKDDDEISYNAYVAFCTLGSLILSNDGIKVLNRYMAEIKRAEK